MEMNPLVLWGLRYIRAAESDASFATLKAKITKWHKQVHPTYKLEHIRRFPAMSVSDDISVPAQPVPTVSVPAVIFPQMEVLTNTTFRPLEPLTSSADPVDTSKSPVWVH